MGAPRFEQPQSNIESVAYRQFKQDPRVQDALKNVTDILIKDSEGEQVVQSFKGNEPRWAERVIKMVFRTCDGDPSKLNQGMLNAAIKSIVDNSNKGSALGNFEQKDPRGDEELAA